MAITKIQSNAFPANLDLTNISVDLPDGVVVTADVADGIITSQKLGDNIEFSGSYIKVPVGTTAQRPGSATVGSIRYNTDFARLEQYTQDGWAAIDTPPVISSLSYSGNLLAADPAGGETITLTGSNFQDGFTVTVDGTTAPSTTFVSATEVRFTTPAKAAGDYEVKLQNANGLTATLVAGISYNGTPAFTTAAGKIGDSLAPNTTIPTITIVAAEPDGGTLAYSITSGALPSGLNLASNGQITGTTPDLTATTTYNFTVTATDDENQTNSRAFNLVVLRKIYAYNIQQSLKFNDDDSQYLVRTPSSSGNLKTYTQSLWVKRGNLSASTPSNDRFFSSSDNATGDYLLQFDSSDKFQLYDNTINLVTNAVYRDTSAWYHFVVSVDTTQATASNRVKIYVNGDRVTSFSTENYPSQNADTFFNRSGFWHAIGAYFVSYPTGGQYFDGYITEVNFIDGQALDATAFGELYNGVWVPKAYSGSYGTNGFYLNFSDAADVGGDQSGNNNDWTLNNFNDISTISGSPGLTTPQNIFDGSTSTQSSTALTSSNFIMFTAEQGIPYTSSVEVYVYAPNGYGITNYSSINGGAESTFVGGADGFNGAAWITVATGSGTLNSIKIRLTRSPGESSVNWYAIRVDGTILDSSYQGQLSNLSLDTPTE